MKKTHTTSEMIAILEDGLQAKMISLTHPMIDIIVEKKKDGIIIVGDSESSSNGCHLPLTPMILESKWSILKPQISFECAVQHIRSGKTVRCEYDGSESKYDDIEDVIFIGEAISGKWYLQ